MYCRVRGKHRYTRLHQYLMLAKSGTFRRDIGVFDLAVRSRQPDHAQVIHRSCELVDLEPRGFVVASESNAVSIVVIAACEFARLVRSSASTPKAVESWSPNVMVIWSLAVFRTHLKVIKPDAPVPSNNLIPLHSPHPRFV